MSTDAPDKKEPQPARPAPRGKSGGGKIKYIDLSRLVCPICKQTNSLQKKRGPGGKIKEQACRSKGCGWKVTEYPPKTG